MAKKRGKTENLIKASDLTPEQRKERARKGGIASGKAKAAKRDLRKAIDVLLESKVAVDDDGNEMTGAEVLAVKIYEKACQGNVEAMKLVMSSSSITKEREIEHELDKARLKIEQERLEIDKQKTEAMTPDKEIKITIGGYEESWAE